MTKQYTHKATEVEAVQFSEGNFEEVCQFIQGAGLTLTDGTSQSEGFIGFTDSNGDERPVRTGDYVIKGVAGIVYPCDSAIFNESYEVKE